MATWQHLFTTALAGAGTTTITLSEAKSLYRFTGTVSISAGQTIAITPSGTPIAGTIVDILWEAEVTLANDATAIINFFSSTLRILGNGGGDLPALYANKRFWLRLFYDGSAWQPYVLPDFNDGLFIDAEQIAASAISTTKLLDEAVTLDKQADLDEGSIIIGGASDRPVALDISTDAQIVVGNGTTATSVAVSGDITLSNAGVVAIASGVIVNADINASAAIAFSKLAALSSANILVGSAGNVATSVSMSGDIAIDNTGATTIQANAVENSMMADDSITLTNLDSTGQLDSYTTTTATAANTTETTLASFAIPTGAMDADGETVEVFAYGSFAATANNKTIRIRLGATLATATQLCANTTTAAPNNLNWILRAKIFRTGAASQKGTVEIIISGVATEIDNFTATETWSTSTIYVSGENGTAAANDIVLQGFEVVTNKENNN